MELIARYIRLPIRYRIEGLNSRLESHAENEAVRQNKVLAKRLRPSYATPGHATPSYQARTSHGHLCLQLAELFLLVVFFDSGGGRLAFDLGLRRGGHAADFVAHWDGSRVEHLLVQLLLLEFCEFFVKIVFVDGGSGDARGDGLGDLVGDILLFAEICPAVSLVIT